MQETPQEYEKRLKEVVEHINQNYNVEDLCKGLPKRIEDLIAAE